MCHHQHHEKVVHKNFNTSHHNGPQQAPLKDSVRSSNLRC